MGANLRSGEQKAREAQCIEVRPKALSFQTW